jgi:acyl-CoA synthetase (AMP-forming)/AMP-acid ligase II
MYLTQTLHRSVQQAPDRTLTICGERTRTAVESEQRIARLAAGLRSLGVADDDRVGMLSLNSDRYHEYLLAVPWANAALNPLNVRWSAAEVAYALDDSDTRILIVDDAFATTVPALQQMSTSLKTVVFAGDGPTPDGMIGYETLIAEHEPVADAHRGDDALLGVFYTGGTTGHPKGVMLSHRALLTASLGAMSTGSFVTPRGCVLHAAPMFHLADLAMWSAAMFAGSTHVIVPTFTAEGVRHALTAHRIDDVVLVPTMIQMLVDDPGTADSSLPDLRNLCYGASPISPALLGRAERVFPNAGFTQAYGMTELASIATLLSAADHKNRNLHRSAGRGAPHVEIRVADENDNEVPRGTVGEIQVRGDNVMLGYWQRPTDTETALRGGWMHTGDGGYMDADGYIFNVDRIKDMIVSGGENIYSAEVENALSRHPAVAACAVIGVPDERFGERVHAVVVLHRGHVSTEEELRAFCRNDIAGYKLPRSIKFAAELPVSGTGKILKRELRKRYWAVRTRQVQ